MRSLSFIALRWFHCSQVDFYSTQHSVQDLVDVLHGVATEQSFMVEEVFEHF